MAAEAGAGADGWREAEDVLRKILARYKVPPQIAEATIARSMKLIIAVGDELRQRAPRNPGLTVPLSAAERTRLQEFYSAYELAVMQSIVLAVIELELPNFRPTQSGSG